MSFSLDILSPLVGLYYTLIGFEWFCQMGRSESVRYTGTRPIEKRKKIAKEKISVKRMVLSCMLSPLYWCGSETFCIAWGLLSCLCDCIRFRCSLDLHKRILSLTGCKTFCVVCVVYEISHVVSVVSMNMVDYPFVVRYRYRLL